MPKNAFFPRSLTRSPRAVADEADERTQRGKLDQIGIAGSKHAGSAQIPGQDRVTRTVHQPRGETACRKEGGTIESSSDWDSKTNTVILRGGRM